jgi:predicted DNA-binding helix-hairpin-helix protein
MWLYPVTLPSGGKSVLLKTLMSNACVNDCLYCPTRNDRDIPHCSLAPEEVASVFMEYVRRKKAFGLFLSSTVVRTPDATMERLNAVARIVRERYGFPGYIHLKVIPGASDPAIEDALSLAHSVSLNIEVPNRKAFSRLSSRKEYDRDIIRPLKKISELTGPGAPFAKRKQTTQFVVGASDERDVEIVRTLHALYKRLRLHRVYYSAYQKGMGDPSIPGEKNAPADPGDLLTREHRLYQVDYLFRDYGWDLGDIPFGGKGDLSLSADPKQVWADRHPEFFPVRLRSSGRRALLRVPGLGPITVRRILRARREGGVRSLHAVGLRGKRGEKVKQYVVLD